MPRLIEGNVALQVLAATTQSPRHLDLESNDDRSDDVVLLALAQGWPRATWRRLLPRALHLASRRGRDGRAARTGVSRSSARRPTWRPTRRGAASDRAITAGLLAIEGAHALDRDPANVEVLADAGYRMMSPSHFFDNAFGGSAHGIAKGGLTPLGPRDGRADGGALHARRRGARVAGDDRRRPGDGRDGRSSPRTRGCAGHATTRAT